MNKLYCEISPDSDVKVYLEHDRWVVQVVDSFSRQTIKRITFDSTLSDIEEWFNSADDHLSKMNLPFVGRTFTFYNRSDCYRNLLNLREIGYRIPEDVLGQLK